jgi:hypothetical protein
LFRFFLDLALCFCCGQPRAQIGDDFRQKHFMFMNPADGLFNNVLIIAVQVLADPAQRCHKPLDKLLCV